MRRSIAAALLLLAPLCHASASESATLPDAAVFLVETFGAWDLDARRGQFRFVVTKRCSPEHCADHLYVQWIESVPGADGRHSHFAVLDSSRVSEIGDFAVVQQVTRVPPSSSIDVLVVNTYTMDESRFCVALAVNPGSYVVNAAPCPPAV